MPFTIVVPNKVLRLVPRVVAPTAMRPYSIAVSPRSSAIKRRVMRASIEPPPLSEVRIVRSPMSPPRETPASDLVRDRGAEQGAEIGAEGGRADRHHQGDKDGHQ